MLRIAPVAAFILMAPLGAQTVVVQPAPGIRATETRTVPIAQGGSLKVSNVNGHIRVTVWERPDVEFTGAFVPGAGKEQVKVVLEPRNGGLEIRGEYPKDSHKGPVCEMDLKVPRSVLPILETVNGLVELKDVAGAAACRTVNGAIRVEHLQGALTAETVNGGITGSDLAGPVTARTVNGAIRLAAQNLKGRLKATTVNGTLRIRSEGARDVSAAKHRFEASFGDSAQVLQIKTVNGDITLD
ncbi:DUF4097 family beta strand repeat-containing protein [Mesoterricola silvestris]|uniref:DUF4097 domain-containing protein n=1 Tax=Mesoterricola silvestris TaxID=2927979 RepID=A0AA48K9V5_9BACT|nr:DUF4097 family beta strand repeat-containing protein [Mesoterricola silvestris]BDU70883.1 hypothetical protein METEAL_00570 [Mesoterricola silvestris]